MTLDLYSWGFRRSMRAADVMDMHTLLTTLVQTIRFAFRVYTVDQNTIKHHINLSVVNRNE